MTAIAADSAPDIATLDRLAVGGWAARGALESLDPFIAADNFDFNQYYNATREEAMYEGSVYALPRDTDLRVMYYNRDMFRDAGLDPMVPPRTWTELVDYSKKLTDERQGRFRQLGLYPICGNPAWLFIYALQNETNMLSADGRTATLDDPYFVEALEWVVDFYDQLGGAERVAGFTDSFGEGGQNPFLTELVAMHIAGDWIIGDIARFRPELDFGVAPVPVPDDRYNQVGRFAGKPQFISWSGGWSFVMPKGSDHPEEAWEVIKWLASAEGFRAFAKGDYEYNQSMGRPFVPRMTSIPEVDEELVNHYMVDAPQKFVDAKQVAMDLMQYSSYRPVSPVTLEVYAEHKYAIEDAIYHRMSPEEALRIRNEKVQDLIDEFHGIK
jgi:multiple sugar transport system substrate-binding protein